MIIGIAGGSGSGKSTFCNALIQSIGAYRVAHLEQDHYYRPQPNLIDGIPNNKELINYDHPSAIDFALLHSHVQALECHQAVQRPHYDFATHNRTQETKLIQPNQFIIVEGILILSQPKLRALFDLALFVEANETVRFQRRATRDQAERGRTYESIKKQFKDTVNPMHELFVEPSRKYAHMVISGEEETEMALRQTLKNPQLAAAIMQV